MNSTKKFRLSGFMEHFNLKGVIGKGGMGAKTLKGCQDTPGVYFHAIGGAASLIDKSLCKVPLPFFGRSAP